MNLKQLFESSNSNNDNYIIITQIRKYENTQGKFEGDQYLILFYDGSKEHQLVFF